MKKQLNEREQRAYGVVSLLKAKYKVEVCPFDRTAIIVSPITEKQFSALCRELHCSGTYNEERQTAILTNFGMYRQ